MALPPLSFSPNGIWDLGNVWGCCSLQHKALLFQTYNVIFSCVTLKEEGF